VAAPIEITSLDDERIAVYRDVRDADLRGRDGLFMAESELVVRRLLGRPERLHSLLLSHPRHERLAEALSVLDAATPVYVAHARLISEVAGFSIHRGVLAAGRRPAAEEVTLDAALGHLKAAPAATLLVAEGLTNVDNMGALFRNAAAFGVDGIVLDPTCCDPLYRKAIRVSMGHSLAVPYAISADWPGDLERLKREWGMMTIGAEATAGASPLWRMPRRPKTALIFGSEGHGLSPSALAACDAIGAIPMAAGVPSLNVAVASAVFLYELRRGGGPD